MVWEEVLEVVVEVVMEVDVAVGVDGGGFRGEDARGDAQHACSTKEGTHMKWMKKGFFIEL